MYTSRTCLRLCANALEEQMSPVYIGGRWKIVWGGGPRVKNLFQFSKTHRFSLPYASLIVLNQTYPSKKCLVFVWNRHKCKIPPLFGRFEGGHGLVAPLWIRQCQYSNAIYQIKRKFKQQLHHHLTPENKCGARNLYVRSYTYTVVPTRSYTASFDFFWG